MSLDADLVSRLGDDELGGALRVRFLLVTLDLVAEDIVVVGKDPIFVILPSNGAVTDIRSSRCLQSVTYITC